MKTRLFLAAFALFAAFSTFSCDRQNVEEEEQVDFAMLRGAKWNVDKVVNETYVNGKLSNVKVTPFGAHTDRGVCTFHFEDATNFRMHDNGQEMIMTYRTYDRFVDVNEGAVFGVRKLESKSLELAVYAEQSWNPCQTTDGVNVYYLSRASE